MIFSERTIKDYNDFVEHASNYLRCEENKKQLTGDIANLHYRLRSATNVANGKSKATKAQRAAAMLIIAKIGIELAQAEHLLNKAKQLSISSLKNAHVSHDYLALREEPIETGQVTVLLPYHYRSGDKVVAPYYGDDDNPRVASCTRHVIDCKGSALIFGDLLPGRDWKY